ncbi:MAG: transporter substrate-binding protein [Rhodospirillaceae bacterium]|nr:transporter substrate-binding protein [Rhodospirillales bacterium]
MDRRHFLGAAAAAALYPHRAFARSSARIALLLPLTGEHAPLGQMLHGMALAAVDAVNRGKLAGERMVTVTTEDWASDPRRFDALARRLTAGEGRAASVFGPCPHASRVELGRYLDQVDGLLWDPAGYEGGECSGGILHGGPTPHQSLTQLLPFMAQEVGRRFLLVSGDGAYSRALSRAARWGLERMNAVVVAEARDDRLAWLHKIGRERIDVVFCSLEGAALVEFLQAAHAARVDPLDTPIASPTMTELESRFAAGHVACQPYFADFRSLGNDRFLAGLRRRLGPAFAPNAVGEALWGQIHLFASAVAMLDDIDPHPVLVREAARGREVLLPQGRVRVEAHSPHLTLWPKIAVAEANGRFKIIARSQNPVSSRPFWGGAGACPEPVQDRDTRLDYSDNPS